MKKSIFFACMFFMIFSADVSNAQVVSDGYTSLNVEDTRAVERADVIIKQYRVHEGKLQYRHWNETQGEWVEPDWITIS